MQLEDALVAPKKTTLAAADLVQVYDISAQPQGAKVITVANFLTAAINALPTSAAGLTAGQLWLDEGILTVV